MAQQDKKKEQTQPVDEGSDKTVDATKNVKKNDASKSDQPKAAPDESEQLKAKVDELTQQLDEANDKYLRAEAEIQNMNNRFKKEQAQLLKYDGQSLAKAILPVMDNLKRALEIEVSDENGQQLKKGIQMVHDHLEEALTSNGVSEIAALDQKFDPTLHQAVQTVAVQGDQQPDTVVQVFQAGYQLKDRVLRPAMVVVAQ